MCALKVFNTNFNDLNWFAGFQCEHGMMKPSWKFMEEDQNHFSYDPATATDSSSSEFLSSNPLLKDPLENYWVEVQER